MLSLSLMSESSSITDAVIAVLNALTPIVGPPCPLTSTVVSKLKIEFIFSV